LAPIDSLLAPGAAERAFFGPDPVTSMLAGFGKLIFLESRDEDILQLSFGNRSGLLDFFTGI
jgi:hypothetical protein